MMAVAAAITDNDLPLWTVVVEQPRLRGAGAGARLRSSSSLAAIVMALLVTVVFGYFWGRSFIQRIFALTRVTRSIAEGKLETRVELSGKDEIRELGDAFNSMADRLVELQDDIRKQERQVMFGRIAAGLVHDLSHPIMNIGNGCKLIVKMWDDADYRETFRRMFERELQLVKRVLEDLQNIAKPIPLERFPVELNRSVGETIESMQALAETAGITLQAQLSTEELYVEGDVFALGRVYRNLVVNAIQATAPGGLVVAAVEGHGRSRADSHRRHRLRHPGGPAAGGLRGFRHDQTARARVRARDHAENRRTAGRAHQRRQRSRQRHDVRHRLPAHQRPADGAGGGIVRGIICSGSFCTRARSTWTAALRGALLRAEDGARHAAFQLRGACSTPATASSSTTIR